MDAKQRRRQSTRAAMQRLRERQQHAVEQLHATVRDLEATLSDRLQQLDLSAPFTALPLPSTRLDEAQQHAQSLVVQNSQLQRRIDEYVKWQDRVALLLNDVDASNSRWDEPTQRTPFSIDCVPPLRLSEARAAELILLHRQYLAAVDKKWRSPTRAPYTSQFLGWDIQYVLEATYWYRKFTKRLENVSAHTTSERAWRNAQQMRRYRRQHRHQRIVQHVNDDTFLVQRWAVNSAERLHVTYHLRFRLEEPDGSIGIAMQTLPSYGDDMDQAKDAAGDDVCLFIKFTPVRDEHDDDVEHCIVEYSGRIHFGEDEHFNALELVIGLARWEEVNAAHSPVRMVWS